MTSRGYRRQQEGDKTMFYDNIRKMYAAADTETRRASREHWEGCLKES